MAYEVPGFSFTGVAAADLTGKEGLGVVINSNGLIALAGDAVAIDGILRYGAAIGRTVTVVQTGIMGVIYGDTVAAGDGLTTDSAGRFVPAAAGEVVSAKAFKAGAVNTMHKVLLNGQYGGVAEVVNSVVTIPLTLSLADNGDLVTDYVPGFAGKIKKLSYLAQVPATTEDKTATITVEIGAIGTTGGSLVLTTANAGTAGAVVNATAITAANVFGATDKISIVAANTAAPFIEGSGSLMLVLEQ